MKPHNDDPYATRGAQAIDAILILFVIILVAFMVYSSRQTQARNADQGRRDPTSTLAVK